jgi:hypothetical protein
MNIKGENIDWIRKIDENHDRIITTCQIEMEFKKHRQKIIMDTIDKFKMPNFQALQAPIFMAEEVAMKKITKNQEEMESCVKKLKIKMKKWLVNLEKYDEIFKSLQRLFKSNSKLRLDRLHKQRNQLKHKARTRFSLGYPPRKSEDVTIGDALNWEWIIWCAKENGEDIILVTRDSDFFQRIDSGIVINTWLGHEFKDRVSLQRKIYLYERLSQAFKKAGIQVSKEEEKSEKQLVTDLINPSTLESVDVS